MRWVHLGSGGRCAGKHRLPAAPIWCRHRQTATSPDRKPFSDIRYVTIIQPENHHGVKTQVADRAVVSRVMK